MSTAIAQAPTLAGDPFDLADERAFRAWRDAKLASYPADTTELVVEVRDPRSLSPGERAALLDRCRRANMAVYASPLRAADKNLPRRLGEQLGLRHLSRNWLADDDGISPIQVAEEPAGARADFIPYTNRPIRWHTDGYYHDAGQRIRGMILHCVASAAEGGENTLLDHEIVYLALREADSRHAAALLSCDAMTIPARTDETGVARAAVAGPVFEVDRAAGALNMRYTARTRSIEWRQTPEVLAAVAALEHVLATPTRFHHAITLAPGMGVVCNNVLHRRGGFVDDPKRPRLLYRARYFDRVGG